MADKYMETVARYGNLASSPTTLKGMSGVNVTKGINRHFFRGDILQHNFSNLTESPTASFNTTDLKVILDETGLDMVLLTSTNKIEFNWRKMDDGGTFVGGGSDVQKVFNDGVMFANSLSCTNGEPCTIGVQVIGAWDGTTAPLTESKTATASAEVQEDYAYTISAMKFGSSGGVTIPIQSINIDLGLQVEPTSSDGELYPREIYKTGMNTSITIETMDLAKNFDYTAGNLDLTDDLIIYFSRLQEGGTRYADGSSQHIKMVVSGHMMFSDGVGESTTINIVPLWDGTNALFSFATTSTIT